jgi:hypothetical protein
MAAHTGNNFNLSLKMFAAATLTLATLTLGMGQAAANEAFNFSFAGTDGTGDLSGSGTLTASTNGDGSFTVISGTGTEIVNGVKDTLTLATASQFFTYLGQEYQFTFDNLLFPSADPTISDNGLLFSSSNGTQENLYSNGPDSYGYSNTNNFNENTTFVLTAVPEPATVSLIGLGLLGFTVSRRNSKNNKNT